MDAGSDFSGVVELAGQGVINSTSENVHRSATGLRVRETTWRFRCSTRAGGAHVFLPASFLEADAVAHRLSVPHECADLKESQRLQTP